MDLRKLKTILDLFENSAISELELSEGEERLRLVKGNKSQATQVVSQQLVPSATRLESELEQPGTDIAPEQVQAEDDRLHRLTSPMVGTYYAQPTEDDPPYVTVGDHVTEGDVVCVVEAMKLFNNVSAPVTGTVMEIPARNGEPVGYGDLLMTFDPD